MNSEVVVPRNPPGKCTPGGETKNNSYFCFSLPLSLSVFALRLLESSLLNAEVKEGEILPPTIQRLMKGYNKYLRPFFDSKETADTCSRGNDRALRGKVCLTENERGSHCNFVLACPFWVIYADIDTFEFTAYVYIIIWDEVKFISEIGLSHNYFGCNEMIIRKYMQRKTSQHWCEASKRVHNILKY